MTRDTPSILPHAVILAGGFGTRLRSRISDRPKALAPVNGRPFLEHQLDWLIAQRVCSATLAVHYLAGQLEEFVDSWNDPRLILDCIGEKEPLGTGGAVANVVQEKGLKGTVLVLNGDTQFSFFLDPAVSMFDSNKEKVLLIAAKKEDVARYGTIGVEGGRVISFNQATGCHEPGVVNAGLYLFDTSVFSSMEIRPFSLENDFFPHLISKGELLAYITNCEQEDAFFDIGTPDAYDSICARDDDEC